MKRLSAATYAQLYHQSAMAVPVAKRPVVAQHFLRLLRRQRALRLMPRIVEHLQRLDDAAQGRTRVRVTSASAHDAAKLEQYVTPFLGPVAIDLTVEPAVRGGLVLRVGDDEIDGSLRTRLHRLHHQLKNA